VQPLLPATVEIVKSNAPLALAPAPSVASPVPAGVPPDLAVESDFDNGNAIVRYLLHTQRKVIVEPRQIDGAVNIWWRFKIHGIVPGETLTISTNHSPIAGDCHPVYSYDGEMWHRFESERAPYRQRFVAPSVEVARNIPYSYQASLRLAQELGRSGPHVSVEDLATSEHGRLVKLIVLTDPDVPDDKKRVLWVQARQHAFESHSSRVADALARWAASDDPDAIALRRLAVVHVVPIMDVDNVFRGGAGKSQWSPGGEPHDLNRSWGPEPRWRVIEAVMARLQALRDGQEVAAAIDLHNPWYHDPAQVYVTGASAPAQRFVEAFQAAVRRLGEGNVWEQFQWVDVSARQASSSQRPARYEPARYPSFTGWARDCGIVDPERGIDVTLEIPHWKDGAGNFITARGLRGYGVGIGCALRTCLGSR
jgi:hypothetical protein